MKVIGSVTEFSDRPYKGQLSEFVGPRAERAVWFSDKYFVSKLAQSWEWIQRGKDDELRKFRAELFKDEESAVEPHNLDVSSDELDDSEESPENKIGFYLDLEQERVYTELLKKNGVIRDLPGWRRKASLIYHLVKNGVITSAVAPLTLPAGAFGIVGRMATVSRMHIATCLNVTDYTPWNGERPIRFLTMNLAGTPSTTMNNHNLMPPSAPRVRDVVNKILSFDDVDIICFQEAFNTNLMIEVAERLKDKGWSSVYGSKYGGAFKLGSGVFIATRLGMIEVIGFKEYNNLESWDKDSAKGVLAVVIRLNDDTKICVATTHMQAGYPKDSSLNDRIDNKASEFHQAQEFIAEVVKDLDVNDVFFMGDCNLSRFTQNKDSLDEVIKNPLYDAMVGFLREGYKDFTIPNRGDSFDDYLKREIKFKSIPTDEERGMAAGTCFNSAATSFHYAVDIVAIQLKEKAKEKLSKKQAKKMVVRHLQGKSIKKSEYAETIDELVQDLEVYVKANTVDRFFLQDREENRFKPVDYEYFTHMFFGPSGSDSDHRGLIVTVGPI